MTTSSPPINLSIREQVAHLRLNRPEIHNAFDDQLIAALIAALDEMAGDPDVRVVVISGEGASFSAGADLHWMRRMATADEASNHADAIELARLMRTLAYFPKPSIARVNGAAFGGGVGLIACCDIAIAVEGARLGLTEARLGLVPAVISPYVIDAIGPRWARRWFQTAELFTAADALRVGLVHEVVAADKLDDCVDRVLKSLLANGPVAVGEAKRLVERIGTRSIDEQEELDKANATLIARLRVSEEGQEGVSAFLDKRKPVYAN